MTLTEKRIEQLVFLLDDPRLTPEQRQQAEATLRHLRQVEALRKGALMDYHRESVRWGCMR